MILFIYFWRGGVFLAVRALLWTLLAGFPLRRLLLLQSTGSRAPGVQELRLPGPRAQAQASRRTGERDLPRSGMEPRSRALTGRFFATEPPGKPLR